MLIAMHDLSSVRGLLFATNCKAVLAHLTGLRFVACPLTSVRGRPGVMKT